MSGGRWNYTNDVLVHEILGYYFDVGYGLDGKEHDRYLKDAIHENALADPEISGLVYDIFCLLHSYDWAEPGDTDMDAYQKDVAAFKKRWFKKTRAAQIKEMIDICADNLKEDLYRAFGCNAETNGEPRVQ